MDRNQCKNKSVPDLRGMCKRQNVTGFSSQKKDWLVVNCCLDVADMTQKELRDICSANDIPNYTKLNKNALQGKVKLIQQCDRKSSAQLRKMCSQRNASYSGMTKDEMSAWCCMGLDVAFNRMGIGDIKKYLKNHGVKGYSSGKKADLVPWAITVEECSRKPITELRNMCKANKVKGYGSMNKNAIVNNCCVPFRKKSVAESVKIKPKRNVGWFFLKSGKDDDGEKWSINEHYPTGAQIRTSYGYDSSERGYYTTVSVKGEDGKWENLYTDWEDEDDWEWSSRVKEKSLEERDMYAYRIQSRTEKARNWKEFRDKMW